MVEEGNHRVQILNPDLTFASMFGSRGTENGQFINPCDVAFNSCGDVFVLDRGNLRIQVFTSGGEYVWQFTKREYIEGGLKSPQTIAIDSVVGCVLLNKAAIASQSSVQMVTWLCHLGNKE